MKNLVRLTLLVVCLFFCHLGSSRAETGLSEVEWFKKDIVAALAIFHNPELESPDKAAVKRHQIWALLDPAFNEKLIIPNILTRTWPELTPARAAELLPMAGWVIKWKFIGKLYKYQVNDITFLKEWREGDRLYLEGKLKRPLLDHWVVFVFVRQNNGWAGYDLKVSGMSLIDHYRRKFDQTYFETGLQGLKQHLIDEVNEEFTEMGFDPDSIDREY